ncbi:MAG TPA: Gfo/Idh/MocA family oxidoreductase, partial [Longimicrobium sp.]|nr:Gfo/Idh/MocA family oxidoreductase [Longimicrobium sp.]
MSEILAVQDERAAALLADDVTPLRRPKLGFLGVGWIGRHRMEAIAEAGLGEIAAISDTSPEMVAAARETARDAEVVGSLDELLGIGLDGIVIATPSALHAEQS